MIYKKLQVKDFLKRSGNTMKDVSSGQHNKTRQHHTATYITTSRCNFMLFYASKMAVSIASLCVNVSD